MGSLFQGAVPKICIDKPYLRKPWAQPLSNLLRNPTDPEADNFAILDQLEDFRVNGALYFRHLGRWAECVDLGLSPQLRSNVVGNLGFSRGTFEWSL